MNGDRQEGERHDEEHIPTDMGEELICLQCEFEAESIEHMRETPGH